MTPSALYEKSSSHVEFLRGILICGAMAGEPDVTTALAHLVRRLEEGGDLVRQLEQEGVALVRRLEHEDTAGRDGERRVWHIAALQCGERIVMLLNAADPEFSLRFPEVLLSLRSPTAQSALRTYLGWSTGVAPDVAVVM